MEAYGVSLFLSVVKEEAGRKKYNEDGETIPERWSGVDDLVLISGATRLELLNKKAGKSLEMINWMRNHSSPAHSSDHSVEREDVVGLVLILQKNLFEAPFPDPGHSVSSLFEPVKKAPLTDEQIMILNDLIQGLRLSDIRIAFGFMLDLLCKGETPAAQNIKHLFPQVWSRSTEELRKTAGIKYHLLTIDKDADDSSDKAARVRLLDFLTEVGGIKYIPDATRAIIYRRAAENLQKAKDKSYGWADEITAAKTLQQFGAHVPAIAFDEVYQEILSVWCGNFWGKSAASVYLKEFIEILNTDQIRHILNMFENNERVQDELFQDKPKRCALELLNNLRGRFAIEAHKAEVDKTISTIKAL